MDAIAERLEFLAGIRKGLDQIERGETVSHEEVKRQLATWLSARSPVDLFRIPPTGLWPHGGRKQVQNKIINGLGVL